MPLLCDNWSLGSWMGHTNPCYIENEHPSNCNEFWPMVIEAKCLLQKALVIRGSEDRTERDLQQAFVHVIGDQVVLLYFLSCRR